MGHNYRHGVIMNSITKLKSLFGHDHACTGQAFNWIKKCITTLSPNPAKLKVKKIKRKSIQCRAWRDCKQSIHLSNPLVWTAIEKPSYKMLEFYFKYKSFSFFNRLRMYKLLHLDLAVDFISRACPQLKDVWTAVVPALRTDQQHTKTNEFIKLIDQEEGYPFSHFSYQFFPSSPQPKLSVQGSCNIINIPIQTQWYKKVYQKDLHGCVLYTGFDSRTFLVTHIYNTLHEESLVDSTVTFYDAWVLLPQKKLILKPCPDLTESNTERLFKSIQKEVTFLTNTRVVLIKISNTKLCYALTYPDTNKIDLQAFVAKAMSKLKGLLASETLALITKEKPPTFRSLFRGLSPIPFGDSSKNEPKVKQEVHV